MRKMEMFVSIAGVLVSACLLFVVYRLMVSAVTEKNCHMH